MEEAVLSRVVAVDDDDVVIWAEPLTWSTVCWIQHNQQPQIPTHSNSTTTSTTVTVFSLTFPPRLLHVTLKSPKTELLGTAWSGYFYRLPKACVCLCLANKSMRSSSCLRTAKLLLLLDKTAITLLDNVHKTYKLNTTALELSTEGRDDRWVLVSGADTVTA